NLIELHDDKIKMTKEGRDYSLQVIRNHRLWEKFLAEETGVKEIDWHAEAEHAEHHMSPEEADELAAKIGNPLIDPHGDPIPTSDGIMPERRGKLITELRENEYAEIIHLEDEPREIYKELVDEGLYPGMYIQMKGITKGHILFIANGKGFKIKSECGSNISVSSITQEFKIEQEYRSLSTLNVGESGRIFGISNAVRGKQRRRLLDFGIVPGTDIVPCLVSFSGEPIAYNIRGTSIALRKEQTDLIFIEDENNE
ncbi:MAG: metal-dependent transcriptional regulator, partial [Bacteroidota bacterium]